MLLLQDKLWYIPLKQIQMNFPPAILIIYTTLPVQ